MKWFLLIVCATSVVEVFLLFKAVKRIQLCLVIFFKVVRTFRSPKISDHWKEKVLPMYAWQLFLSASFILVILIVTFIPVFGIAVTSKYYGWEFSKLIVTPAGVLISTLFVTFYAAIRTRF